MEWFALVSAIIKAVPAVKAIVDRFIVWYVEREIKAMKREHAEAITVAILKHDQRPLEEIIGSSLAGKPSGIPGTQIVDTLPGVDK